MQQKLEHFPCILLQNDVSVFNQLTYSNFMKALAELAVFIQLDSFYSASKSGFPSEETSGRNWSWFPTLCMAADVTNALFKRQPFPDSFAEAVGLKDVAAMVRVIYFI